MFLTYCAYTAFFICLAGLMYRICRWFVLAIGPEAGTVSCCGRIYRALGALIKAAFHWRFVACACRVFFLDIILQQRLFRQSKGRWIMHMGLFYGILLLLVMHTFDDRITVRLFADYASTLDPFQFLRNLLGILVLAGIIIAVWRRRKSPLLKRTIQKGDRWLVIILGAIILSGVALEAAQIISPTLFDQMVIDYMGSDDPAEIAPLKAYWAAEFGVVFDKQTAEDIKDSPGLMEQGIVLHQEYCAACHSHPDSAVLSYPLARIITPFAAFIERMDTVTWLWYGHYLVSCLALAMLPFSKLFHMVTTPLSLMFRSLGPAADNQAENRPTRRAVGLDACTHCGVCSQHCAVAPIFNVIPNVTILPSEKLKGVARLATGRTRPWARAVLAEGSFICTGCGRCTTWCPSGIDLQDLWSASKNDLACQGFPDPHGWIGRYSASLWSVILGTSLDVVAAKNPLRRPPVRLADNPDTFRACVQCSICTNVCPVVAVSEDPRKDLEMTPQQVMNLMRLQLKESAMGSRMVWDCVTCYKCQEHCPQGVRVADILYELRNEACRRLDSTITQVVHPNPKKQNQTEPYPPCTDRYLEN
jgi:heterodisulfide reductase subunit C/nitrate reductase gamma subunit